MEKTINCLLIDDDPDDHEIFRMAISDTLLPVSCIFSTTWIQAIEILQNQATYSPDFIFLDWNLPGMEGVENLFALRQISKLTTTQIIIYSGYIQPELVSNLLSTYNCKYLEKSGSLSDLAASLTHIFTGKDL